MLQPAARTHAKRHGAPTDDVLTVIEDEARAVALAFGVSTPDAAAAALVDRLVVRIGGEQLYLPKREAMQTRQRNADIRARFNGHNHAELARRYGISVRWVRRIVVEGARA